MNATLIVWQDFKTTGLMTVKGRQQCTLQRPQPMLSAALISRGCQAGPRRHLIPPNSLMQGRTLIVFPLH